MILAVVAAPLIPMVIAGSTSDLTTFANPFPIPDAGNIFRLRLNINTSKRPIQKAGAEAPIKLNTIETLSKMLYCFLAAMIPIGIPTMTENKTPQEANNTVLGNRSMICAETSVL